VGRCASENVYAPAAIPALPTSRLDGFAVHSADGPGEYPVAFGIRAAKAGGGEGAAAGLPAGHVAWITTGAPLPPGADAVVPVEQTEAVAVGGTATAGGPPALPAPGQEGVVRILRGVAAGNGVRPPGSDVSRGALLLGAGQPLTPAAVATLLSAGARLHVCVMVYVSRWLFLLQALRSCRCRRDRQWPCCQPATSWWMPRS
jgi:molybdopterin biosynthesis enzyme